MPAQQGVGLYEVPPQASAAEETTQSREQCTVRRPQRRANHLATEDRNLVTKHDDFDSQPVAVTPGQSQQLEDSDESEVEERQGHGPVSSFPTTPRKSCSSHPDNIFGTHRLRRARWPVGTGISSQLATSGTGRAPQLCVLTASATP